MAAAVALHAATMLHPSQSHLPASVCAAAATAPAADPEALITAVDIRVGKILKCERHPEADTLYVSQIECGEAEPRQIVSGLVKYVPLESMQVGGQGRCSGQVCETASR